VPRIAGVDIPNEKRIEFALTYIYGIGPHLSRVILKEAGIDPSVRAKNLSEDEISRIAAIIDRNYVVEGQLRRQTTQNIARLKDIDPVLSWDPASARPAGTRPADADERPDPQGPAEDHRWQEERQGNEIVAGRIAPGSKARQWPRLQRRRRLGGTFRGAWPT